MPHFTRDELIRSTKAQELKIDNTPPDAILAALDFTLAGCERVWAVLEKPMLVSSGYRCAQLNDALGGARKSQHMLGQAVDFTCPAFGSPKFIVDRLGPMRRILGIDQLIQEHGWVHMSFTLTPRYVVLENIGGGHFQTIS